MKRFFSMLFVAGLALSSLAHAGCSQTVLTCKNGYGYELTGYVPGDSDEFRLTLKKANKSISLYSETSQTPPFPLESNATLIMVSDITEGVYAMTVDQHPNQDAGKPAVRFVLYAIPDTVRYQKRKRGFKAQFSAKFVAMNLEDFQHTDLPLRLTCVASEDAS